MTVFCRDGGDLVCNREAWRLWYNMVWCHSGMLDYLVRQNLLSPFLELVGTSSNNVIMINGLRYITRVFSMVAREQRRVLDGRSSVRPGEKEPLKSLEKDIKTFSSFFVHRSLFIKVHMIYKKLIPTYSGAAFLELANFYHVLSTSPHCKKLLSDTAKKMEYKLGLNKINGMYGVGSLASDALGVPIGDSEPVLEKQHSGEKHTHLHLHHHSAASTSPASSSSSPSGSISSSSSGSSSNSDRSGLSSSSGSVGGAAGSSAGGGGGGGGWHFGTSGSSGGAGTNASSSTTGNTGSPSHSASPEKVKTSSSLLAKTRSLLHGSRDKDKDKH